MPIVRPCSTEDCTTLTMGELCLDCERALLVAALPLEDDELSADEAASTAY